MERDLAPAIYEFEGFTLDPRGRHLLGPDGEPVVLRPRQFDTLYYLAQRAGEPVSKAELMEAVWPGMVVEENNLNQAISGLRQALGDDRQNPVFIATITGRGYQFVAPVQSRTPAADAPTPPIPGRAGVSLASWSIAATVLAAVIVLALAWSGSREPVAGGGRLKLDTAEMVTPFNGSHSTPAISPDGKAMAFVSDRSGISQIWIKSLPDGLPKQITQGEFPAMSPSWSPLDNMILFQRATADGVQSAWTVDPFAADPPRVVIKNVRWPRFSADGRFIVFARGLHDIYMASLEGDVRRLEGVPVTRGFADTMPAMNAAGDIAFVLADEGPVGNLWVYEADAATFRQLTQGDGSLPGVLAHSPAWLPDGRTVIYSAIDGEPTNFHLWQTDSVTGETAKLTAGAGGYDEPAISRDGSVMLYSYARPLWRVMRTDTQTGQSRVVHETREPVVLPVVSADGDSVVYFGEHIWTLPLEGGEAVQRTFGETGQATLPTWSASEDFVYYYLDRSLHRLDPATGISERVLEDFHWSSRNWLAVHDTRLAYLKRSLLPGRGKTMIHDLESGEKLELDERVLPTEWSRDGRTLLARRAPGSALVLCEAPAFECSPILHAGDTVEGAIPRWSADETRVFFRRARQDKPGYADIWVVPREGGEPARVVEVGPYRPADMFFGVAADDSIIWNQYDRRGISEIWMSQHALSDTQ